MKGTCLGKFVPSAALRVGAFVCTLCFSGCSESVAPRPDAALAPDKAEREFETQDSRPPTPKTLYAMADILATQGKDSQCESILKRVIREDTKFLPAYNALAELQMRQGRTNAAIETLQGALAVGPDDPVLLNNLGMCRIAQHDYENALMMFSRAAGVMPENAKYRANMAVALGLMGRDEESLSLFKQLMPEDQAHHNLSVLREAKKNADPPPAASETPNWHGAAE
jgi:Flp pilus assembly protein TadD